MMPLVTAYIATTLFYLLIDGLWLGVLAKDFYAAQLQGLMLPRVKFGIALLFYIFYTIGVVLLAIKPALDAQNIWLALGYGALLGFCAYGTYDVTNLATLKDWPPLMSVVDIVWGTALSACAAGFGYYITSLIHK